MIDPEKLSFSSIAWPIELDNEVATLLSSRGVNRVDLAPSKYAAWDSKELMTVMQQKQRFWSDNGFTIRGFQSLLYGLPQLNIFAREDWSMLFEHFARVFEAAEITGATELVFGSPKNRLRNGLDEKTAKQIALEFFDSLAEAINGRNMRVLIEPNPVDYGCDFLTNTSDALEFIRSLGRPEILVNLDLGTCLYNSEKPGDFLAEQSASIGYVHLSTRNLEELSKDSNPAIVEFLNTNSDLSYCIEQKDNGLGLESIKRSLDWVGV